MHRRILSSKYMMMMKICYLLTSSGTRSTRRIKHATIKDILWTLNATNDPLMGLFSASYLQKVYYAFFWLLLLFMLCTENLWRHQLLGILHDGTNIIEFIWRPYWRIFIQYVNAPFVTASTLWHQKRQNMKLNHYKMWKHHLHNSR